ncbi:hypothetical protein TIFTF001_052385 [Ficus carica]|uniref:Uncharacterized protein n=1 Tax=Ficus carica TaxID=3494 RepID=A0AA88EJ74_FICCA|nr:hypothetical protein TIFTF001_052384 [Ficus carica]GMN74485.1 hypothetical protein TIFTF001_052385 [Ficus carica]
MKGGHRRRALKFGGYGGGVQSVAGGHRRTLKFVAGGCCCVALEFGGDGGGVRGEAGGHRRGALKFGGVNEEISFTVAIFKSELSEAN